jgi:hypothetical protein
MADHPTAPIADGQLLDRGIDRKLLHLRGLVLVRRILSDRGATWPELDPHSAQIRRLRNELADVSRHDPARVAASNGGADAVPSGARRRLGMRGRAGERRRNDVGDPDRRGGRGLEAAASNREPPGYRPGGGIASCARG